MQFVFIIFLAQFFSISIINYNSSATNTNRLRLGLLNILIFDTIISVYYEKKVTLETFDEKSGVPWPRPRPEEKPWRKSFAPTFWSATG